MFQSFLADLPDAERVAVTQPTRPRPYAFSVDERSMLTVLSSTVLFLIRRVKADDRGTNTHVQTPLSPFQGLFVDFLLTQGGAALALG